MTPVPTNPEMLIIQYAAELGKVKAENAQLKEIEAANKETITYWRGEVARLVIVIETQKEFIDNQIAIAETSLSGENEDYRIIFWRGQIERLKIARAALGE